MKKKASKKTVKEPVQVYLDHADRELLEEMARQTALPRAELLRRGLRKLGDSILSGQKAGSSLESLVGSLDGVSDLPADLAERHDDYLYGPGAD